MTFDVAPGRESPLLIFLFFSLCRCATQVLPCVAAGRLVPCTSPKTLPLSAYVNLPLLEQYHDRILSFEALVQMNQTNQVLAAVKTVTCMHHQCLLRGFGAERKDGLRSANGLGLLGHNATVDKAYNKVRPRMLFSPLIVLSWCGSWGGAALRARKCRGVCHFFF